ncbi:NUDIX hydrolase [Rapidithrix thailandica]|uniref:NUDIX hydrolase n=1 Tax=Rapidithrix thailandica TaxID=413964 RepID=A0AAW9SJA8_9BACT
MNEKRNPWKKLTTETVYDNPWINVREDQVITPAGKEGIYGVVSFKNYALGIIPVDQDGNTWLVGQYRYTLDAYSWEIPMGGGLMENGILESAQRELQEETGLIASHWTEIMKIHTSNSVTDEVGFVYLAQGLTQGLTDFDETEVLQIQKLPFNKAIQMVMNGQITDAISVAGLLKANLLLQK